MAIARVEAVEYVRNLHGGSQPALIKCNDGNFYVVKFLNNPQGPNVLFNEVLGTEIFRQAGLPVPEWCVIHVSERFFSRFPECQIELEHGVERARSGCCFGSRFLSMVPDSVFEQLPGYYFDRIENRRDFWTAWVLDVLCEHADRRQAMFVGNHHSLRAYFIDQGHFFGGADGQSSPNFLCPRYRDSRVYSKVARKHADSIWR